MVFYDQQSSQALQQPIVPLRQPRVFSCEPLFPDGGQTGSVARAQNAFRVEKGIFQALRDMEFQLPFDLAQATSFKVHPAYPEGFDTRPGQPLPMFWFSYILQEGHRMIARPVRDYAELYELMQEFQTKLGRNEPFISFTFNTLDSFAAKLNAQSLRQSPGILLAMARDMSRYTLPPQGVPSPLESIRFQFQQ